MTSRPTCASSVVPGVGHELGLDIGDAVALLDQLDNHRVIQNDGLRFDSVVDGAHGLHAWSLQDNPLLTTVAHKDDSHQDMVYSTQLEQSTWRPTGALVKANAQVASMTGAMKG